VHRRRAGDCDGGGEHELTITKIVFSRKGFDGENGGVSSPIFPDFSMVSLPIPRKSNVQYGQVSFSKHGLRNLGEIVEPLTGYRLSDSSCTHLDPDLDGKAIERMAGWRGIFGQSGSAQGKLKKDGVGTGALFLFFGRFQKVDLKGGRLRYEKNAGIQHVIFGWLKVGSTYDVAKQRDSVPEWAKYHPHLNFQYPEKSPNVIYIAAPSLGEANDLPGWGVFGKYHDRLRLTDLRPNDSKIRASVWRLPGWIFPWPDGSSPRPPIGLHKDQKRWRLEDSSAILQTVGRGQEFVLDCDAYPESRDWAESLIRDLGGL
jgi:Nucleotide modification associated domain 3